MPVTIDMSKAVPIDESMPAAVTVNMDAAIPLPKKEPISKITSALSGVGRSFPGSDLAATAQLYAEDKINKLRGKPSTGKSFGDQYQDFQNSQNAIEEANPTSAMAGRIAGSVPLMMAGGELIGPAEGLAQNLAKSGTLNMLVGQAGRGIAPDPVKNSVDAAIGVGAELGTAGISKGFQKASELAPYADKVVRKLPILAGLGVGSAVGHPYVGTMIGSGVTGALETSANRAEAKLAQAGLDRLALASEVIKDLPKSDPITAGNSLAESAVKARDALNESYGKVVNPISEKYAHLPSDTSGLVKEINDVTQYPGVSDETQKTFNSLTRLKDRLLKVTPSTETSTGVLNASGKPILRTTQEVTKPATISELEGVVKSLGDEANFKAGKDRTPQEAIYRNLYHIAKDDLHNSLTKFSSQNEMQSLINAKEMYSSTRPIVDDLIGATHDKYGKEIVKTAANKLPDELAQSVMQKVPQMKPQLADVVMNHLVSKATSPKAFTKAIDNYGRETLLPLLGEDAFAGLEKAETQFANAKNSLQKPQNILTKIIQKTFSPESYPLTLRNAVAPTLSRTLSESLNK